MVTFNDKSDQCQGNWFHHWRNQTGKYQKVLFSFLALSGQNRLDIDPKYRLSKTSGLVTDDPIAEKPP